MFSCTKQLSRFCCNNVAKLVMMLLHPTNHKACTVATSIFSKLHIIKTDLSFFSSTVLYKTKLTEQNSPLKKSILLMWKESNKSCELDFIETDRKSPRKDNMERWQVQNASIQVQLGGMKGEN